MALHVEDIALFAFPADLRRRALVQAIRIPRAILVRIIKQVFLGFLVLFRIFLLPKMVAWKARRTL
jgi:hypothetical protein